MSIEKKSLISNMTTTKKALIASNTTTSSPLVSSKTAIKLGVPLLRRRRRIRLKCSPRELP